MAAARFLGRGDDQRSTAPPSTRSAPCWAPSRSAVSPSSVRTNGRRPHVPPGRAGEARESPLVDIAIDPVDGAPLTAKSLPTKYQ